MDLEQRIFHLLCLSAEWGGPGEPVCDEEVGTGKRHISFITHPSFRQCMMSSCLIECEVAAATASHAGHAGGTKLLPYPWEHACMHLHTARLPAHGPRACASNMHASAVTECSLALSSKTGLLRRGCDDQLEVVSIAAAPPPQDCLLVRAYGACRWCTRCLRWRSGWASWRWCGARARASAPSSRWPTRRAPTRSPRCARASASRSQPTPTRCRCGTRCAALAVWGRDVCVCWKGGGRDAMHGRCSFRTFPGPQAPLWIASCPWPRAWEECEEDEGSSQPAGLCSV